MSAVRTGPPPIKKPSPWGKLAPLVPVLVVAIVALVVAIPAAVQLSPDSSAPLPSAPSGPRDEPPTRGRSPDVSPRTRAIMRDCRAQLGDVAACASLARDSARRERYVACRVDGLPAWRCLGLPGP